MEYEFMIEEILLELQNNVETINQLHLWLNSFDLYFGVLVGVILSMIFWIVAKDGYND